MKRKSIFYALIILIATILASCGGGGGGTVSGIGGTGITSSGTITGVGSIYVNGVRYNVDNATVTVNDSSSTPAALKVGMVVTVTGELDSSGSTTGTADTVVYDNEIQGPVTGLTDPTGDGLIQQFTIMGQVIEISSTATEFEEEGGGSNFNFTTIMDNDNVEVSGFVDQNGALQATRVEKKTGTEVELKGTVTSYNPNGGAENMGSFMLGSITVDVVAGTDTSDIPGGITENIQVEVKGDLAGTTITARKIELDDDGLGDDLENVELEGIVTGFIDINSLFRVAGQLVDASSAGFEPSTLPQIMADGIQVEVEGEIRNGVLIADEVEARSGEIKLHATVLDVSTNTITMTYFAGNVPVLVDNKTSFQDGLDAQTIVQGDYLQIEGYQDSAGNVIASQVKRKSPGKDLIQGPVDAPLSPGGVNITVLGVFFFLEDLTTSYADQNEQPLINAAAFFAILNVGDTVKIEDDVIADGIADEVELE